MKILNRLKYGVTAFKVAFNMSEETNVSVYDERFWKKGTVLSSAMADSTYFTCMKTLSESVAKLPLKLYKEDKNGIRKATDKPLYNVLKIRPNMNMTSTTFWATVTTLTYHYGNCYVFPYSRVPEKDLSLLILDNLHMSIYADYARKIDNRGAVWYVYSEPLTGQTFKFHSDEILHFKTHVSLDGITGLSVREILSATIDGSIKSQEFINELYENGLTGKIAVEYDGELGDKLMKKSISTFEAAVAAKSSVNFIPVMSGMRLNPLNLKLTDAQFLEMKKYTALQIAAAFGIKPNQLNDYEKSSYANSEQQQQAFLTDTLLVILKGFEEELNYKLLSHQEVKDGYFFKFNVDVILRADFATRYEGYAKARQNGFLSANDIREKEDMTYIPDEEGGNAYLVNGNMVPIRSVMVTTA